VFLYRVFLRKIKSTEQYISFDFDSVFNQLLLEHPASQVMNHSDMDFCFPLYESSKIGEVLNLLSQKNVSRVPILGDLPKHKRFIKRKKKEEAINQAYF